MGEHFGKIAGNRGGTELIVNKAIGGLGPFQNDIWALLAMKCEETTIQRLTFCFQYTNLHLNTSIMQFLNTPTLYFGKRIDTANHHTTYTFLNNKIGARRSLTIVRTWFKTHIYG